jgi:hypothetical protein
MTREENMPDTDDQLDFEADLVILRLLSDRVFREVGELFTEAEPEVDWLHDWTQKL